MPRPRRVMHRRQTFTDEDVMNLIDGTNFFGGGWGNARFDPQAREAMRRVWSDYPELREKVMARVRAVRRSPADRLRPWAWWAFESPQPRDPSIPEHDQLAAMNLLEPEDQQPPVYQPPPAIYDDGEAMFDDESQFETSERIDDNEDHDD